MDKAAFHSGKAKRVALAETVGIDMELLPPVEETIQHSYNIEIKDNYKGTGVVNIFMWGLNRDSETVCVRVIDYQPSFFIKLPEKVNGSKYRWTANDMLEVFQYIRAVMTRNDTEGGPTNYKPCLKKGFTGHNKNARPFMELFFKTDKAARNTAYFLKKGSKNIQKLNGDFLFEVCEEKIDTVRKMLTQVNLKYCQWFRAMAHPVPHDSPFRSAKSNIHEYICKYSNILPLEESETIGWMTYPKLLGIDIETYSDNHNAMPEMLNLAHRIWNISLICGRLGQKERQKHIVILGKCHPIEGAIVHCVNSEYELILKTCEIIDEYDPDILAGYNTLTYDYPYMDTRLTVNELKSWPKFGRLINDDVTMYSKTWESAAYGTMTIAYPEASGRIHIDMLPIIKRNYKLDMYKLDFVAQEFLGKQKHDVTPQEMFMAFEKIEKALDLEVGDPDELWEKTRAKILGVEPRLKNCKKLKQRPDLDEAMSEVKRVAEYCIQDSVLVLDLIEKLNTWIDLVELSSIVGVSPMATFTRGQQLRCVNQIYDLAHKQGYVIDSRTNPNYYYKGALVQNPIPGIYENVICLDFASLYPSIIIAYNICYTTIMLPESSEVGPGQTNDCCFDQDEPLQPGEDPDNPETQTINRKYKFSFVKKEVHKGVLPTLLEKLIATRKIVKKQMEALEDDLEENGKDMSEEEYNSKKLTCKILDKRQNALKVSANSMYGFLGVRNEGAQMPLLEGAMSVTAYGRQLITEVNEYVKAEYGATIVYGDTDSSMIAMPRQIKDSTECFYWGNRLVDEISGKAAVVKDGIVIQPAIKGLFPPPLRVEFEKAMRILVFKKKKYAYLKINKEGKFVMDKNGTKLKIEKKGIILARRDNCKYARELYERVLDMILRKCEFRDILKTLIDGIVDLLNFKVPKEKLIVIRSIGSSYKQDTYFMKVFADAMQEAGHPAMPGERVPYLIIKTPLDENGEEFPLGLRMRSMPMLAKKEGEVIDVVYYLGHMLMNSLDQLFEYGCKDSLNGIKAGYQPVSGRSKFVSIDNPIRLCMAIHKDYVNAYKDLPFQEQCAKIGSEIHKFWEPLTGKAAKFDRKAFLEKAAAAKRAKERELEGYDSDPLEDWDDILDEEDIGCEPT